MPITRKTPALLLLTLALAVSGCATPQSRQLGDGTVQPLAYSDNGPELASNDWAAVTQATTGFAGEPDAQFDVPFWWQFGLKLKTSELKAIDIYDVTAAPPRLLLTDSAPAPQGGEWRGRTSPEKFSREAAPWFFTPGASEHVFKIVLTNSRDEERALYQACLHSEEAKKARVAEIVRLTAPEIKVKLRKTSTAPKPTPTTFPGIKPKNSPPQNVGFGVGNMGINNPFIGVSNRGKFNPNTIPSSE